jgi:hypothetical protein
MGVLDDAIREHLDLKRQHGAAEDEIARQETEALGPARRAAPIVAPGEEPAEPGTGERRVIEPVADVAPPPEPDPEEALERPRVAPVHDIDEDPLAPPPPVAGALIEGAPTEPAPIEELPPRGADDPDATVEHDALWSEPERRRDRDPDR